MRPLAAVADRLPDRLLFPAAAWYYRLRPEKELLLVDQLVDASRNAVDVGAWWGPWTYWLSRRCPEVVAVEPNPSMAAYLRRVVPDNVVVESVALSDATGEGVLRVPEGRGPDALAHLDDSGDGPGLAVTVPLRRLDDLEVGDLGFLKIDVEGHEYAVLDGGLETLDRHRPVILVELEEVKSVRPVSETIELLVAVGYQGWIRRRRAWAPIETFDIDRDQRALAHDPLSTRYINNFVFVPSGHGPPDARG